MSSILLFDDDIPNQSLIKDAIREIDNTTVVDVFPGDSGSAREAGLTYEQLIERQLFDKAAEIGLIACDQELGLYKDYPGLSANAISVVARNLGIPFCQYSQHPKAMDREIARFKMLRRWDSEEITLASTESREGWGKEIFALWQGFEELRTGYAQEDISKLKPSESIAKLMGRDIAANRIALYGSGDQTLMTEIFGFAKDDDAIHRRHRMPRVLGMWLRLSLLRFPGLLVNEVAAASYLNISLPEFAQPKIREQFEAAKYAGPFCELSDWWWRDDLDSQLLDAQASDGKELLRSLGITVEECVDEDTGTRAGYYCMITEKPVSRANSKGNINWFPSGADLARIRTSSYDQITSLVST